MPCCKSTKYSWCKELPVHQDDEGKEYCVFHASHGKKKINPEEFIKQIYRRIHEAQKEKKLCDLSGSIFDVELSFSDFDENNPLPEIKFSDCIFWRDTHFSAAEFRGRANFERAKFTKEAIFVTTEFKSEVSFRFTNFESVTVFMSVNFYKKADFHSSIFKQIPDFLGIDFKEEGVFQNLRIQSKIRIANSNLRKVLFGGTDLRRIDFVDCNWAKRKENDILYDEIIWREQSDKAKTKKTESVHLESLYRMLKQKCKEDQDESGVSKWHYCEKEMQRWQSNWKNFSFYVLSIYWLSSGYAEKPVKSGIVLLALLCAITFLLAFSGLKASDELIEVFPDTTHISVCDEFNYKQAGYLFLNTLKYATFQKDQFFKPAKGRWDAVWSEIIKLIAQILIPLQVTFFALSLRNRFRR